MGKWTEEDENKLQDLITRKDKAIQESRAEISNLVNTFYFRGMNNDDDIIDGLVKEKERFIEVLKNYK